MCEELSGTEPDLIVSRDIPCGILKYNSIRPESPMISVRYAGTTPRKKHLYVSVASRALKCHCNAVMCDARAKLEVRQKEHRIRHGPHTQRGIQSLSVRNDIEFDTIHIESAVGCTGKIDVQIQAVFLTVIMAGKDPGG